jgi:hypothetical protein
MANYEVPPAVLSPWLPTATELDLFDGRCLVSVVGFRFLDTRVFSIGVPGHRNFDEVNLRFYVKRREGDETRRGVVFVKEIVPRRALAWVARVVYQEPYVALPLQHEHRTKERPRRLAYTWIHNGRSARLAATLVGEAALPEVGSEAAFITEHYWGYTRLRDGATQEYQVEHPPWRVWAATDPELDCDVAALYGAAFAPYLAGPPRSSLVADGSEVVVRRGRRVGEPHRDARGVSFIVP